MKRSVKLIILSMMMALVMIPCIAFAEENEEIPSIPPADETTFKVSTRISGDAIAVKWEAVEDATKYRVYRSYSPKGSRSRIAETGKLEYKDNTNKSGKTTYYYVKAYVNKKWSEYSEGVSNKITRVYIDAGHGVGFSGKFDPGTTWKSYKEYKLVTPIAAAMADNMKSSGAYVYTDAYKGNNRSLPYGFKFVKKHNVSAFISIHCDWYKAQSGTLPLYRTSEQKKLARALNEGVHSEIKIKDRGLKKRNDLKTLTTNFGATACLYETGSIKADNKILTKQYKAYGKGLARGMCEYVGLDFKAAR